MDRIIVAGVMNHSAHMFALLVATSGLVAGCIPVVRTSVVHYGVEAKLVDAETAEPIAKQRIKVTVDGQEHGKKTDRSGTFKISPDRHHYWAWLMGGPHWAPPRCASIQVTMEGYTPYQREWAAWPQAEPGLDQDRLREGYVNLGRIEMGKRQPDGAANRSQPVGPDTNRTPSAAGSGG